MDKYPGDLLAEFRRLRRDVDELKALLRTRTPLTTASAGWFLPNRSTPAAPSGGAHIYASGGELVVSTGNGQTFTVEPPPQGASVDFPPVLTSPSAPGSVTVEVYQLLRDDCQSGLRATLIALITSLRNAGIIASPSP